MSRIADPRTKIELLRAAESVFAEHGLAASKVEHITARAGVSKGAFYLHFESKEEAFRQLLESFLAHLSSTLRPPSDYSTLPRTPATGQIQRIDSKTVGHELLSHPFVIGAVRIEARHDDHDRARLCHCRAPRAGEDVEPADAFKR